MWLLCLWSWGTCGFPLRVLRWLPFSGSAPNFLRLDGLLLRWTFFVRLVGSWYTTWFSTLCQRCLPFHCFPLAGSAPSPFCCLPFAGAATFQAPVCGSTPAVVGGVFAASLGFLPCAVLFFRGLQLAQLSQLQVTLGFSSHRVSVLLLPW